MSALKVPVGLGPGQADKKNGVFSVRCKSVLLWFAFNFSFVFTTAETRMAERENSLQAALQEVAAALKEEAVTPHQGVASLERELESTEEPRRGILVRLADSTKGYFLNTFWPSVNNSKEQHFQWRAGLGQWCCTGSVQI